MWKTHLGNFNIHSSKIPVFSVYSSQDMEATQCPLTEEWIKKMWYIYTMEYYSTIKQE